MVAIIGKGFVFLQNEITISGTISVTWVNRGTGTMPVTETMGERTTQKQEPPCDQTQEDPGCGLSGWAAEPAWC